MTEYRVPFHRVRVGETFRFFAPIYVRRAGVCTKRSLCRYEQASGEQHDCAATTRCVVLREPAEHLRHQAETRR